MLILIKNRNFKLIINLFVENYTFIFFFQMSEIIETERLILREMITSDDERLFILDSNPEVHKFLGNNPISTIDEARYYVNLIRTQYQENGIGRWAVIEKESNLFIGWSGLKVYKDEVKELSNFYELGYRLMPQFWGKGYATETAKAWLNYGFENFETDMIYGMTDINNHNSKNVLKKVGFTQNGGFDYENDPKQPCDWFEISRKDWLKEKK